MPTPYRISDLRTDVHSVEEADAIHREWAGVSRDLAVLDARFERRIGDLKTRHAAETADARARLSALQDRLSAFVRCNPGLFEKPRLRKTELGDYGRRVATELQISDEQALVQWAMDKGYDDCLLVKRSPIKGAIRQRVEHGERVPGAVVKTGDTVVVHIRPEVVRAAIEEAVQ